MDEMTLFCVPYAGGSAAVYDKWKKYADGRIKIVPVELAGKGRRFNENPYDKMEDAVDDVYETIKKSIDKPYGLFGHSMGGMITYELAHKISNSSLPNPEHIFVSGIRPPHLWKDRKIIYMLPDKEFKEEIIDMGGTPKEIFENKELLDLFLPIIKKDFKIVDKHIYDEKNPLNIEMTVFYGDEEEINDNEANQWGIHTNKKCRIFKINGNHFFINDETEKVVDIINDIVINNYKSCLSVG
ncbi:thioesterase II family protein [Wukongibacter sp. M2B1]|uniref:thioesterase II family protein n=1 Tax=Wukongibacter sp. M2B1 TaxID=3088895 RepID=UPI003D79C6C0|nr:thioesterase [Wukongibacter baidiensis]